MPGSTTSEEEGLTYIIGTVRNNCDRKFSSAVILFKLDGNPGASGDFPQGSAYAYASDLEPGETRPFKPALPVSRNATFQFEGINAY
jgi:hypothetical protein